MEACCVIAIQPKSSFLPYKWICDNIGWHQTLKISPVIISGKSPGKQKITFIAQKTLPHLRYASCINLTISWKPITRCSTRIFQHICAYYYLPPVYLLEIRPISEMAATSPPVASSARSFFKQNTQVVIWLYLLKFNWNTKCEKFPVADYYDCPLHQARPSDPQTSTPASSTKASTRGYFQVFFGVFWVSQRDINYLIYPDRSQRRDGELCPAWSSPLQFHDPLFPSLRLLCCQAGQLEHWIFGVKCSPVASFTLISISGDGRFFWLCSSSLCAGSCHHGCCCGQRHHCCVCHQGFQVLSMKCFDCSFVCKKIWITHIFSREENVKEKNKTDWMGRTFLKKLWNCDFCDLLY